MTNYHPDWVTLYLTIPEKETNSSYLRQRNLKICLTLSLKTITKIIEAIIAGHELHHMNIIKEKYLCV